MPNSDTEAEEQVFDALARDLDEALEQAYDKVGAVLWTDPSDAMREKVTHLQKMVGQWQVKLGEMMPVVE